MTYEQITKIINSIQTEYPELESDMYDAGNRNFRDLFLIRLANLELKDIELENYNDVQSQRD